LPGCITIEGAVGGRPGMTIARVIVIVLLVFYTMIYPNLRR
jgi:hypothetical protein